MAFESKIAYILAFLLLLSDVASAGLGVSGAIIERKVDPGEAFAHEMTISSDHASPPMDLIVDILGMNQTIDGDDIELGEGEDMGQYSARALLKATPSRFHLEQGDSQNVILDGNIPSESLPGGRYALINIHSLPIGNGTVGIIVAVDVPVRLTVSGKGLKKSGRIEDIRIEEPISSTRQNISLILRNTGNCHYKAKAHAMIEDLKDHQLADASTPASSNIIPGAFRIFQISTSYKKGLEPGEYLANLTVGLDNGTILDTKEVKFRV